jgi:hypothetical protein
MRCDAMRSHAHAYAYAYAYAHAHAHAMLYHAIPYGTLYDKLRPATRRDGFVLRAPRERDACNFSLPTVPLATLPYQNEI